MHKKFISLAILFVLSSTLLFGKTLATVNGHKITDEIIPAGYDKLDTTKQKKLINGLVREELLYANLLGSDVVKSSDFETLYAKQKEIAQAQYKQLQGKTLSEEQLRNIKGAVALVIYQNKMIKESSVSSADVKKFYDENKAKMTHKDSAKIVALSFTSKDEATKALAKIKSSSDTPKAFESVAKETSQRGFVGWVTSSDDKSTFFKEVYGMKTDTLCSAPIFTGNKYAVVYLVDKKPAGVVKFDEAKNDIEMILKEQKALKSIQSKIVELEKSAKVIY